MKNIAIFFIVFLLPIGIKAQNPDYTAYSKLLTQYVSEAGKVDYIALKKNQHQLNDIISYFEKQDATKWANNDERLAFCINVYNANTLKLIVDNYPVRSIKDLDGGKPWDVKRIKGADKLYSLNQIENEIIRPVFKDPRVHFALNCAAVSCPPLYNKAFLPQELNAQLDDRARKFIQSTVTHNKNGKIVLSKIFDWYKPDFGDVIAFINKYSTMTYQSNKEIQYEEYDWKLNIK